MRPWVLIVALSCTGCSSSLDYTPVREPPRPMQARSADRVEVFLNEPPKRPFVEVGVVEAQQQPGSKDQSTDLIAKMRAFAGQHGCDGLANFTSNDFVTETMDVPGGGSKKQTLSGYRASCIVYSTAPEPSVPAATPAPVASVQAAPAPAAPAAPAASAPVCAPNATQLCFGPAGCRGGQSCTADGRGWSPCDCGPTPQPSAAAQ